MHRLFRQFSFPGGIPSHAAPDTPGSIHEGGELGYSLSHAYGAVLDNPDLIVACVVGDGEAETGPLATSWHGNKFLNPATDGAVLPILHLNGYKIANPTVLARIPAAELHALMSGYGYDPIEVAGYDPDQMHQAMAAAMDRAFDAIRAIQRAARGGGTTRAAALADDHPAQPEGLDRPEDRGRVEDRGLLARPPGAVHHGQAGAPAAARRLDAKLPAGRTVRRGRPAGARRSPAWRPVRRQAHERQSARQRRPADAAAADAATFADYAVEVSQPGCGRRGSHRVMGAFLRDVMKAERRNAQFPGVSAGRERLQPAAGCVRGDRPGLGRGDDSGGRPSRRRTGG